MTPMLILLVILTLEYSLLNYSILVSRIGSRVINPTILHTSISLDQ